jgi:integrase
VEQHHVQRSGAGWRERERTGLSRKRKAWLEEHNVRSWFFSHEEYLAVRGVLPDYAQVAVSIAYYCGLRIGEVLGLKWSQIDLVKGKLSLTPL